MRRDSTKQPRAAVVVLGDFGRSPRMQYHTMELAAQCAGVDVIAYHESDPREEVSRCDNVHLHSIRPFPALPRLLFLLYAPFKVLWLLVQLLYLLLTIPAPQYVLVQNPPSIPTLPMAWLACRLRGAALVVDWHNFGFSLMAITMGERHPAVLVAKWVERTVGGWADEHITVTNAMAEFLQSEWRFERAPHVLHDRPPSFFRPTPVEQQHELFSEVVKEMRASPQHCSGTGRYIESLPPGETPWTRESGGAVELKQERPAVVVSSTSWTPDEDFSVLLEAIAAVDRVITHEAAEHHPDVVFIITGKGPQRDMYLEKLREMKLERCAVMSVWLSFSLYPKLLGSANIGVSLHTSSSGLDLPMKVVDMFGCHLPVCAIGFQCIDELVKHGKNGIVFATSQELTQALLDLLEGFPNNEQLAHLSSNASLSPWTEHWQRIASPIFQNR